MCRIVHIGLHRWTINTLANQLNHLPAPYVSPPLSNFNLHRTIRTKTHTHTRTHIDCVCISYINPTPKLTVYSEFILSKVLINCSIGFEISFRYCLLLMFFRINYASVSPILTRIVVSTQSLKRKICIRAYSIYFRVWHNVIEMSYWGNPLRCSSGTAIIEIMHGLRAIRTSTQ